MIGRLNHVAIAVPDLQKAAKTYAGTLGAKISAPVDQPAHGVVHSGGGPGALVDDAGPAADRSPGLGQDRWDGGQDKGRQGEYPEPGKTSYLMHRA